MGARVGGGDERLWQAGKERLEPLPPAEHPAAREGEDLAAGADDVLEDGEGAQLVLAGGAEGNLRTSTLARTRPYTQRSRAG